MATTPRGYPIFTGAMPPAGPVQMQQLAEAIDADLSATVFDTGWMTLGAPGAPILAPGWARFSTTYGPPSVRKRATRVSSGGLLISTAATSTQQLICTLPVGWRPTYRERFATVAGSGLGVIEVHPDGRMVLDVPIAAGVSVSLTAVSFEVAL